VLDVQKLCFLYKQSSHSVSVHNVFYDVFGLYEFTRLCPAYSVSRLTHGHLRLLSGMLFTFLYLRFLFCIADCIVVSIGFCLLHYYTFSCVNKDYQNNFITVSINSAGLILVMSKLKFISHCSNETQNNDN